MTIDNGFRSFPRCEERDEKNTSKEYITLHIGQAGIQIGHALWELLCLEHGISLDGVPICDSLDVHHETIFTENNQCSYVPKCLFVDTEPTVIDEIRTGAYRNLFTPEQLVSWQDDAASNYMRGRYFFCHKFIPTVVDRMRSVVEKTSGATIVLVHSTSGGTGGGLAVTCLENIYDSIGVRKADILELAVLPPSSKICPGIEVYNHVLYAYESQPYVDISLMVSNDVVYNIFEKQLNLNNPTYVNVNRFIAQNLSNLTAGDRFNWIIDSGITSMRTNLLPFRQLRYLAVGYAPVIPITAESKYTPDLRTVISSAFSKDHQLMRVNLQKGSSMACSVTFRGLNFDPNDTVKTVQQVKKDLKLKFVDWSPIGCKVGIINAPYTAVPNTGMASLPYSVTVLSNNTDMGSMFQLYTNTYRDMYSKRCYMQWLEQEYDGDSLDTVIKAAGDFQNEMAGNYSTGMGAITLPDDTSRTITKSQGIETTETNEEEDTRSGGRRINGDTPKRMRTKKKRRPKKSPRIAGTPSPRRSPNRTRKARRNREIRKRTKSPRARQKAIRSKTPPNVYNKSVKSSKSSSTKTRRRTPRQRSNSYIKESSSDNSSNHQSPEELCTCSDNTRDVQVIFQ